MCGFAGIIQTSGPMAQEELGVAVERMANTIRHRGPDDAGAWVDERARVALGFRRLAILDLTDAAHQPYLSPDNRYALVFNGEIYNHADLRALLGAAGPPTWRGHSDTETLLTCFAAWGIRRTLKQTVGMFALALWDRVEHRLFLARDRFGEKPLYYGWTRNAFLFGSELKALRQYPGFDNPVDPAVVPLYLQYCYVPAPYAIYRDIYKLGAGCLLSLSADDAARRPSEPPSVDATVGTVSVERYWSLTDAVQRGLADPIREEQDAIDRLAATLGEAVRLQSVADVPLGAFLSGGIDSSTVVALMQSQSIRKVKTFTIGFTETPYNEAEHAKAVAAHLGTDHTEFYVSSQQALAVIPRLPDLYSEPFADSSQIPTHLVSVIARQQVTVALSGDGGDELFGGYTRYLWGPRLWKRLHGLPTPLRRGLGATIQMVPFATWNALGAAIPGRRSIAQLGEKAHKLAHRLRAVDQVDDLYEMLVTTWPPDARVVRHAERRRARVDAAMTAGEPEHLMMLWDALTYLPDDILHKVDRASMAVGLETRAPFLDHRVAELAWRLPLQMKIRNGTGKWILRQLLDRHVPRELIERPKMGFTMPVHSWLRGPLREWAEGLLSETTLRSGGYFHPDPIRRRWEEHLTGARNWHNELWCVLMFQAWLEKTGD